MKACEVFGVLWKMEVLSAEAAYRIVERRPEESFGGRRAQGSASKSLSFNDYRLGGTLSRAAGRTGRGGSP